MIFNLVVEKRLVFSALFGETLRKALPCSACFADFVGMNFNVLSPLVRSCNPENRLAILRLVCFRSNSCHFAFFAKNSRLFRKWCEKHKKAVIASLDEVGAWQSTLCQLLAFAILKKREFLRNSAIASAAHSASEAIHYARSAFKSPLPCAAALGVGRFCGENSTNANFAHKFPQNPSPAKFGALK